MDREPLSESSFDEDELATLLSDPIPAACPSFAVCGDGPCQACMQQLIVTHAMCRQLSMENRGMIIKYRDRVKGMEDNAELLQYHNEQKQRFLEKQTQLVDILSKEKSVDLDGVEGLEEYTSACGRCVYHRDMWRRVRSINLEQQKRCEIDSVNVRKIQQQQAQQLEKVKMAMLRLRGQYEELKLMKTDPFCRDSEIVKLRQELEEAKAMTAGYNRTAFNANNEARMFMEQLDREKARSKGLSDEITALKTEAALHHEKLEVLKRIASPESSEARKLFALGECGDLVCRNRILSTNHRINMLTQQLNEAQERCDLQKEELSRVRTDCAHWRKLYDAAGAAMARKEQQTYYKDCDPNVAIPAICLGDVNDAESAVDGGIIGGHSGGGGGYGAAAGHLAYQYPTLSAPGPSTRAVVDHKNKPFQSNIGPRDELTIRLQSLFELIPGTDAELDESEMYDEFMLDQEQHKREQIIEQMYASCHDGALLPENERKRYRQAMANPQGNQSAIRSCKRSFSACLRAIGGVMVKRRSRNIWLNFRQTRVPIFKWCARR
jgi:hypothetical protein